MKDQKKIYRGTIILAVGTLLSRVLGFGREMLAARFVGGGHEMDIFALAYRIPNLMRGILGEKAAESAFLPVYKTLKAQGQEADAEHVSADVFKVLLISLFVFVATGILFAPYLVTVMGKGFEGITLNGGADKFASAVIMTRLMLPAIIMIGFFSFLGARMLAREQFAVYTAAPIIANTAAIATILFTYSRVGWYCLAWGVLAGVLSECVFFWLFTPNRFSILGRKVFSIDTKNPNLKKAGKLWGPITFGSGIEKIGTIIETQMASFLGMGAVSALYYANLVNLLSFSILGLSFNRSVIPHLTQQNALNQHGEFKKGIVMGIRMNLVLLLPVSVFVVLMRGPIIQLLFQRGRFDAAAAERTAIALLCYSFGLVAMGMMGLFSRAFYAVLNTKTPIRVSVFTLILNIILNFLLWKTPLRHAGLALATSIAYWTNAILLFFFLNRTLKNNQVSIRIREIAQILIRVVVAAAVLGAVTGFLWPQLLRLLPQSGLFYQALRMALVVPAAALTFLLTGMLCGIRECILVGGAVVSAFRKLLEKKDR